MLVTLNDARRVIAGNHLITYFTPLGSGLWLTPLPSSQPFPTLLIDKHALRGGPRASTMFPMWEENHMLIVNDEQRLLAGVLSLEERCKYCSKAFAEYPFIQSDDADQTVYHVTCALELATESMVDLYTFFSPPAPYNRLFVLTAPEAASPQDVARR